MKRILSLAAIALCIAAFTSCSDNGDSLPDVDLNFTFDGATRGADGNLYAVQGTDITVTSIEVVNKDSGKPAMITAANYYWDYYYIGSAVQPPFTFTIAVSDEVPVGRHLLQMEAPLFAEDKEAATAVCSFNVVVVASPEDIPDGGVSTFSIHPATSTTADS